MEDARKAAGQATDKNPAVGLTAVATLRRLVEGLERLQVDNARQQGWSWEKIALCLGVTKQAVHQKYSGTLKKGGKK